MSSTAHERVTLRCVVSHNKENTKCIKLPDMQLIILCVGMEAGVVHMCESRQWY